jgi:acyl carrier protein
LGCLGSPVCPCGRMQGKKVRIHCQELHMDVTNNEMFEKVRTVLAQALKVKAEDISSDTAFGDLPQWDSMGHMEVMILLEENFGVEINADTISELTSVQAIYEHVTG